MAIRCNWSLALLVLALLLAWLSRGISCSFGLLFWTSLLDWGTSVTGILAGPGRTDGCNSHTAAAEPHTRHCCNIRSFVCFLKMSCLLGTLAGVMPTLDLKGEVRARGQGGGKGIPEYMYHHCEIQYPQSGTLPAAALAQFAM